jgi:predicted ATP-binding protein involved in virulence
MRLEQVTLTNFRCYQQRTFDFHPNVNLIVGQNATGKTALLDAISVAMATWLLGFKKKPDNRGIVASDATLTYSEHGEEATYVESWPVKIAASGSIGDNNITWERSKETPTGNTRYGLAGDIVNMAKQQDKALAEDIELPLLGYYGTMRLWQDPSKTKTKVSLSKTDRPSRLDGYKHSVDPRIAAKELVKWFAKQEWRAFQQGQEPVLLKVVRKAVLNGIEGATQLRYDANREELLLTLDGNDPQPFSILSDGQRCVLALIADIAQKAAMLNPHMGEKVLELTQGVVLIDELDLHLHPRWQRTVIEDLRLTFPNIQFICTTHSPFLIQSLHSGEELIMLDGQPTAELANKTLEDIAVGIMAVNTPEVSHRYAQMKGVATEYLKSLNEAQNTPTQKLEAYKERLVDSIAPYADNPAFQAFLEMNRVAKIGS